MNTVMRVGIVGGVIFLNVLLGGAMAFYRSPFVTNVNIAKEQVVPFSHKHHVAGLGIDCRYCHTSVDSSPFAGIPPTETCMTCHSQVWTEAPMLQPVRDSWDTGKPLVWNRVTDLPDFVYFNHSIHVNKGIGCTTCHGQVDQMPLMSKANTFHMSWCLQCHKAPEKFIRPKDQVYSVDWKPGANQLQEGKKLVEEYGVRVEQLTNCSVCHR
ncbi:MAG: cytochrome c family protein [Candidatus Hydrogenedentes bacterium]|nr:cytochrome c family protein [Candidatus Hydrogenedentota bacterium]